MAGLVPALHVLPATSERKTWMPGTRPGMTNRESCVCVSLHELTGKEAVVGLQCLVRLEPSYLDIETFRLHPESLERIEGLIRRVTHHHQAISATWWVTRRAVPCAPSAS